MRSERIYCCCGRQAINEKISNEYATTLIGSKSNFGNTVFCGECAGELDHNGLFPEEIFQLTDYQRIAMGYC